MTDARDRPNRQGGEKSGAPGSDDQFARRASPHDAGADVAEGEEGRVPEPSEAAPGDDDLRRELEEQRDKYLRLAAEYDNFRKRTQRERLDAGTRAQADLTRHLLEPLDDLARFAHLDPETTETASVVEGVDMVDKKLRRALTAAGLEILEPVDQTFDPAVHEAVATEPALSAEDENLVARVYQPGYVFKGLLLRPARVVVKQWNG
ncbi:MAG TPA: nucleotide exchange factor GrpE [Gemmatimonadaceae bacterium]|nr:nucleotide exchange factor GrpE [Gemmatimonadaceae bacterium]